LDEKKRNKTLFFSIDRIALRLKKKRERTKGGIANIT
jgi:hypothetical protein